MLALDWVCAGWQRLCLRARSILSISFPPIGFAMTAGSTQHVPVLAAEVLAGLGVRSRVRRSSTARWAAADTPGCWPRPSDRPDA